MTGDLLRFLPRLNPSANSVLLLGPRAILVDTGFGSGVADLEQWLHAQGTPPHTLSLIVNTHHHSDHVGGNHHLQQQYALPVAAHPWEAHPVNHRHPEACGARWLNQPVQAYQVQTLLHAGDTLDTGHAGWQVLHTPGHSPGHLSLHHPDSGTLIAGDAALPGDVGWVNLYRDGLQALEQSIETTGRLAALNLRVIYPGHGEPITDPARTLAAAHARLTRWRAEPEKVAWHGCKRILTFALMYRGGLTAPELDAYFQDSPWFHEFARHAFALSPDAFRAALIQELLRAGAAAWVDGRLTALGPHAVPAPGWLTGAARPQDWTQP
ncbi:MBL fold metallo-hydrolase [Deinococcus enclensis]|uniref:Glyoxylase-like metal-dependent hydrolase (Beta-lactamase superfamily II) n=1 Tax=Deinococcus enclensis TaxID=1049582 RepID=A0ABT9MAN6_9DEIO|nr:MBL fold metallo-hydrolase [Deinococcus enclensis]MDP9763569.1 glyoxylase-like metal-dependent hydrolase (beta-lactamase superfamily II) [Deinococcus enclensis]